MNNFTNKEIEIIKLLCLGTEEIGKRLFVAPATIQTHIQHIRQKVGATSRASIIVELLRAGVVDIDEIVTD